MEQILQPTTSSGIEAQVVAPNISTEHRSSVPNNTYGLTSDDIDNLLRKEPEPTKGPNKYPFRDYL